MILDGHAHVEPELGVEGLVAHSRDGAEDVDAHVLPDDGGRLQNFLLVGREPT